MSHFTVLVITEDGDYESALKPFDENLDVDEYIYKTADEIIAEEKQKHEESIKAKEEGKETSFFDEYHQEVDWNNDKSILENYHKQFSEEDEYDKDGNLLSTSNPNGKWDWYQLGGRWLNSFKLKPNVKATTTGTASLIYGDEVKEGYTDHAQFKDIDFTPDQDEYKKAERFWEVVVEGKPMEKGEDKETFETFWKPQYYLMKYKTKEEYAKCMSEVFPYAVLYKGEWIEPGEMGWFGCDCSTEDSNEKFRTTYREILKNLEPETWLSMVDCHI